MGAASSKGVCCGKCGNLRRKYQQMKGGAPICQECYKHESAEENAELRREIHELKAQIARMKRDGFTEQLTFTKRVITPPEQRFVY